MSLLSQLTTDERQVTPHLQDEVPPDTTDFEVAWEVPRDGTVEGVRVWAVPGSEDALEIRPVVRRDQGPDRAEDLPLPTYGDGEQFITGEPDGDPYHTSQPVEQGDHIVVKTTNTSADYAYRFRVLPYVDYAGGLSRYLGG
ncbi:hypothetical protein DV707_07055 [Halobellus limi]|nr:hypothetical protein [Halobellus limi]QCC47438.1 hypothetical protein DV707_07055 [Halobellus limi]